ncbi:oligopeptide/dipeptide ABC transporter ATP-binding protein [Conexibacter sp. S30A1]|uniref:oligopeptide/dipeptide ABC transporter ATP-binding protein n=1 Tax=Conexibacter sp. S30A1 TaxID=2937800 RepID=UPI00200FBD8F|nr:oligopeptide/dipeptide ABC transporter ATP-binding protein [Conexibacter sp. S30A1]
MASTKRRVAVKPSSRMHGGPPPVRPLDRVSIRLEAGCTIGIVGESGCWKSTLARPLVGLGAPTSSTVAIAEEMLGSPDLPPAPQLARLAELVFQDPYSSLKPSLSVEQVLTAALQVDLLVGRGGRRGRALELLEMVPLSKRFAAHYPYKLSGGQAQRAAVARALAVQPKVMVLDEPTYALDVSVRAEIMELLIRLQDELGLSYVFVSHDLAMVRHISDQIVVMYLGRVVEHGPYQQVLDESLHPYTRALASAALVADPAITGGLRDTATSSRSTASSSVLAPGCPYQPRCSLAEEICLNEHPALQCLRPEHAAACHIAARQSGVRTQS